MDFNELFAVCEVVCERIKDCLASLTTKDIEYLIRKCVLSGGIMLIPKFLWITLLLILISSCNEKIEVFKVKKNQNLNSNQESKYESILTWEKLPKNWVIGEDQNKNSMRLLTIDVIPKNGEMTLHEKGLLTVIKLPGNSGDLLSNVNRWRNQIGLNAINERVVNKIKIEKKGALSPFLFFNFEGEKESMVVSIFEVLDSRIFVKLTGKKEIVDENKDDFISFCEKLGVAK